jgi:hypothetical protein
MMPSPQNIMCVYIRLHRQEFLSALSHNSTLRSAFLALCSCTYKTQSKQASKTIIVQEILARIDGWSGFWGAHGTTTWSTLACSWDQHRLVHKNLFVFLLVGVTIVRLPHLLLGGCCCCCTTTSRQPFEGLHCVHLHASTSYGYGYIEQTHEMSRVNGVTSALSIGPSTGYILLFVFVHVPLLFTAYMSSHTHMHIHVIAYIALFFWIKLKLKMSKFLTKYINTPSNLWRVNNTEFGEMETMLSSKWALVSKSGSCNSKSIYWKETMILSCRPNIETFDTNVFNELMLHWILSNTWKSLRGGWIGGNWNLQL